MRHFVQIHTAVKLCLIVAMICQCNSPLWAIALLNVQGKASGCERQIYCSDQEVLAEKARVAQKICQCCQADSSERGMGCCSRNTSNSAAGVRSGHQKISQPSPSAKHSFANSEQLVAVVLRACDCLATPSLPSANKISEPSPPTRKCADESATTERVLKTRCFGQATASLLPSSHPPRLFSQKFFSVWRL